MQLRRCKSCVKYSHLFRFANKKTAEKDIYDLGIRNTTSLCVLIGKKTVIFPGLFLIVQHAVDCGLFKFTADQVISFKRAHPSESLTFQC